MGRYTFFSMLLTLALFIILSANAATEYSVVNRAAGTPGGDRFSHEIGSDYAKNAMVKASDFILNATFQQTNESDRKNISSVTLIVENSQKKKISGLRVSGGKIHVSDEFIEAIKDHDARRGFTGVLYHVMTHVWQWKGNREAPKWLIEGIADFVRLEAGFAPEDWVKPGGGDRWDRGHDVTARFLEHCNNEVKKGFVAELNKRMRAGYTDGFFVDILGKTLEQLWTDYKAMYIN